MIKKIVSKKSKFLLLATALILILTLSGCSESAENEESTPGSNEVLAVVNGTEITEGQFQQRFNIIVGQYQFDPENPEHVAYQEKLEEQVLNSMIDEIVLLEEAAEKDITVTEEEINQEISMYKASFSSEEEFENYLSGSLKMNKEEFEAILKNDMMISKLFEEVTMEVDSTPISAEEYFKNNKDLFAKGEEVSATHILVEKENEAKAIIEEIQAGANMNEIAAEKSIDPSAKNNMGELGYFAKGAMVPEFENVAFSMEVGEIYPEPVKSDFGYHVIRVNDKKAAEDVSFADVEEEITSYLLEEQRNKEFSEYIDQLRNQAEIEMK